MADSDIHLMPLSAPSKRGASEDDDHDRDDDLDDDLIDDTDGSHSNKRKKYMSWTSDMVQNLLRILIETSQKKDLCSVIGKFNPKGWKHVENEIQRHYPDVDLASIKTKYKSLRKGFDGMIWCEAQHEKLAVEGHARFQGETFLEYFDRINVEKPKGWKLMCRMALQCEPFSDMIRQLFGNGTIYSDETLRVIQQQQQQQQQLHQQLQQQMQQHQQLQHRHHMGDVSLMENVDDRLHMGHPQSVDPRQSIQIPPPIQVDSLTPRGILNLSNLPLPNTPRISDTRGRQPSAAATDRRSDELIAVFREFNEIMRESNNTIKTLLTRIIETCPE